ncbi:hypothetical protein T08_13646, partial [Trichinella sp. T8]
MVRLKSYFIKINTASKVILYKPPGEKQGKILVPPAATWTAYPRDLDNNAGHSFQKALESVTGTHANKNFFAYNNAAAGVVGVKTKSNSKDTRGDTDEAAWIVHTVPANDSYDKKISIINIIDSLHFVFLRCSNIEMAILYKPPAQKRGRILIAAGANWEVYPADLESDAGHSFWKTFESVVGAHDNKKFFAYNNAAPGVVGVKTKSNSK